MESTLQDLVAVEPQGLAATFKALAEGREIYFRQGYSGCLDVAWGRRGKDDSPCYANPGWFLEWKLEDANPNPPINERAGRRWYSVVLAHVSMYGRLQVKVLGRTGILDGRDCELLRLCLDAAEAVRTHSWLPS